MFEKHPDYDPETQFFSEDTILLEEKTAIHKATFAALFLCLSFASAEAMAYWTNEMIQLDQKDIGVFSKLICESWLANKIILAGTTTYCLIDFARKRIEAVISSLR